MAVWEDGLLNCKGTILQYNISLGQKQQNKQNADVLSRRDYNTAEQNNAKAETNDLSQQHNSTNNKQEIQYLQTQFEYADEQSNFISTLQQTPTENEEQPAMPSREPNINSKSKTDIATLQEKCNDVGQIYKYMVYGNLPDNKMEQKSSLSVLSGMW